MSRLIVKNLPKKITEAKIREIFGVKGNITDIQLKYTADGKFRQFAFIGYHDEDAAQEAIALLHNSHINTSKITVEPCASLGDTSKPKSWSKYASDSTTYKQSHPEPVVQEIKEKPAKKKKKRKEVELLEKYKDDPQFEEFLQLHAPKEAEILLSTKNDNSEQEDIPEDDTNSHNEEVEEAETKLANQKISDEEYMKSLIKESDSTEEQTQPVKQREPKEKKLKEKIELFTVKLKNLPYSCKKKAVKDFFRPLVPYSIRVPRNIKGIAYAGFKTDKKFQQALLKDRSFMGGKRISVVKYSLKDEQQQEEQVDPKKSKWKTQEEALKHEEDIAESGRIFMRNLAYTTTEDDVEKMFSKFGPVTEVNLPVDFTTRKPKGFGVVTFLMPEHAVKAYSELDGSLVHGRMLHLLPGKAKDVPEQEQQESTNYKQKKALKQKAQAGSSHNWNSLFLGQDAVADVIARTYGTSKEAVLDPHGDGSAAVRLALGETQIVTNTRKYLEQEGVHLDAFNEITTKRSKTIILVKNLPAETKPREIRELFEKYGVIGRLIFPPSGITAIVEFFEPSEARKAFTHLAYSKFKHLPLYLEWAPENSLLPNDNKKPISTDNNNENDKTVSQSEISKESTALNKVQESEEVGEEEEEEPEPDTTLFIKNLNFQTVDEGLRQHFKGCGKIHYATVATKKDKSDPSTKLSMGYGFVRFMYKVSADKALKTLQCSTLDGKTLELKRSERTLANDIKTSKKKSKAGKQTGTKILVRNIPFQANYKEVMELFKTFGEIKAMRLPKKMTVGSENQHRGFAFVDFFTNGDAKKAFEALCQSTHLYGRRLVLEWAATEEGLDEIRKRTAEHFHEEKEVKSKKSVFDMEKL